MPNKMAKLTYINNGKTGSVEASDHVFNTAWKPGLVKEVIVAIQSNRRANTAHSKDRAAVRGADTKPWRQKGTGRARHGSIYSPIWRGGGVTFGPLNVRNYDKKVNRKARNSALRSALSHQVAEGKLTVVSALELSAPKTKEALNWLTTNLEVLKNIELLDKKGHAILVVADAPSVYLKKSLRNLTNVRLCSTADLNVEDAMLPRHIFVFGEEGVKSLESRLDKTE